MTTILIADEQSKTRAAILTALEDATDLSVIGQAASRREALALAAQLTPDIVLMDPFTLGMEGVEAIAAIRARQPQTTIFVFTGRADTENILAAVQAGAIGYLNKGASGPELRQAIRSVAVGNPYLPAPIARKLMQAIQGLVPPPVAGNYQRPLTGRQTEVLALLQAGYADAEIAASLHLEETTVRTHIHHIVRRLGVSNRMQAVVAINGKEA